MPDNIPLNVGGKVWRLDGELTVTPARETMKCSVCEETLTWNEVGVLVCKVCQPQ